MSEIIFHFVWYSRFSWVINFCFGWIYICVICAGALPVPMPLPVSVLLMLLLMFWENPLRILIPSFRELSISVIQILIMSIRDCWDGNGVVKWIDESQWLLCTQDVNWYKLLIRMYIHYFPVSIFSRYVCYYIVSLSLVVKLFLSFIFTHVRTCIYILKL